MAWWPFANPQSPGCAIATLGFGMQSLRDAFPIIYANGCMPSVRHPRVRFATLGFGMQSLRDRMPFRSLRQRRYIPKPRVAAAAHPGGETSSTNIYPEGYTRSPYLDGLRNRRMAALCNPVGVMARWLFAICSPFANPVAVRPLPGCASRPWALGCNPFGIECRSDHYANGVYVSTPSQGALRDPGLWDAIPSG